jgi:[acyl-carrier-protein] S-malonyltransferase
MSPEPDGRRHGAAAATVAGQPVTVSEVDARESILRASPQTAALPKPGTSEGRQLRRWLTQLLVTERVVASEAAALGVTVTADTPGVDDILPDLPARLEVGSIAAAVLATPIARALYQHLTAEVDVDAAAVFDYHRRNPNRFAAEGDSAPTFGDVAPHIARMLQGAARRRAFRIWLGARRAALVWLAPGYEHPGDPRQPDNVHRH